MEPTAYLWLKFKELQANLTGSGEAESFKLEHLFFLISKIHLSKTNLAELNGLSDPHRM